VSFLAQDVAQVVFPQWASSPAIAAAIAGGLALGGVFIGKWIERGNADKERKERRRQVLFDAYAEWLTSFEATLQDYAAYYGPIAWEHEHGHSSATTSAGDRNRDGPTPEQRFKANTWRLRLLERDSYLARQIEELSRAFDYEPEGYSDLAAQALGWPTEMAELRRKAAEVLQRMQSLYLASL
jgi:hypothetical protein